MNRPAKIIAALVALSAVIWIGRQAEGQPDHAATQSAPDHQVRLIAFTCDPNYGRPRADLTVQNTGQTTIEFAKATVAFGSAANDGHLRPYPLRPGGTASATIYSPVKANSGCSLVSVQDRDGNSVSVSQAPQR